MNRSHTIDPENLDLNLIQEVAARIKKGQIIVLPTDTAYGLTGNPSEAIVVQRILDVKQRTDKLGMPLLAASLVQVRKLVRLPPLAERIAMQFWPGALTIIAPSHHEYPAGILGPQNSLAVRVPNHPVTLAIIQATGYPIIGTSANTSNKPSPRTAEAAAAYLGGLVDFILDAGPTQHSKDSTIINCTVDPPQLVREGVVTRGNLAHFLKARKDK
ncbi:MAG: L-threonylcarbamoyladenylate synthase [Promethearchaeota archaeon]